MSKDWCQGFCTLCGTGCGEYCDQIADLRARLAIAVEALEFYAKTHIDITAPVPGGVQANPGPELARQALSRIRGNT